MAKNKENKQFTITLSERQLRLLAYACWWFVEQKMQYNELRPKLNGKKY